MAPLPFMTWVFQIYDLSNTGKDFWDTLYTSVCLGGGGGGGRVGRLDRNPKLRLRPLMLTGEKKHGRKTYLDLLHKEHFVLLVQLTLTQHVTCVLRILLLFHIFTEYPRMYGVIHTAKQLLCHARGDFCSRSLLTG
jgi:hypothetical protein